MQTVIVCEQTRKKNENRMHNVQYHSERVQKLTLFRRRALTDAAGSTELYLWQ